MRNRYSSAFLCVLSFSFLLSFFAVGKLQAQTTITTLPNPPYNGGNSLGGPSNITFVLNNTNPFPVNLTEIGNWCTTTENGSIWQLYFTATALSGTSTDVTAAPWTLVATSGATTVAATGITSLNFTGLSFTIPAATQYRFALRNTGPGNTRYSGTGSAITPNSFTDGGVTLLGGDAQIAGVNVGYSGTGTALTLTPRYFTGFVKFEPAGPCTNPPTPGTVSSTALTACLGVPFTLSLSGGTGGTGQTYQWQISTDNIVWTDIPGATSATLTTSQTSSNYYRCIVTCGASVTSNSQLITTPNAVSGTFTINSALPTGGTNFNDFNDAYDYIKCGINGPVIFNVDPASGPYNEQLIMTPVPGASATNTVTFNGNGRTISFLATNTNERAVIKLNGADHIKFNNLVIAPLGSTTTEFGFGVHLINDADSNAVNNCTININDAALTSTNYAGIVVSSSNTSATATGSALCDGNVFINNTINGGYYGITCVGSNTAANRDNIISGNTLRDFYFYGIFINGNFNTQVDSNTVSRPTRANAGTFAGIYLSGLNVLVNVTRNTITNPFGGNPTSTSLFNGIFVTGVDALTGLENKIVNNRIYNINGAGEVNGINNTGSDNVLIYHNSILLDGDGGSAVTRGFYQTTVAAGVSFVNNIVAITRGGTGNKFGIVYNTATSDIFADNNVYFINSPTGNNFIGLANATNIPTLSGWQTATGDDANSFTTNPLFTDALTGNLRPTNASIDNIGAPLGITNDITGAARSATTPDAGAYEFTPSGCSVPPTPGTAVVNPGTVCENTAVSLSLTGNSVGLGQTYQWQFSTTLAGPYTDLGNVLTNPDSTIISTTSLYYRVAVTCSVNTQFSTPVLLTVNPALPQGTYTINSTQPTGGTNYNSFNDAKAALACGVAGPIIFNVVAGTGPYNEQLILGSVNNMSATNTVTFNGNGNTIAFSSNENLERAVIKLRNADHFIFDNLVINSTGAGTYGFGVHLINNADSNVIRNCTIIGNTDATSTNFAGIVVSASESSATGTGNTICDGNRFESNTITGGYYGITLVGSTTAEPIFNNAAINNTIQDFYFYGIYMTGTNKTLIEGNNISRPTRSTVTTCYGIYATGISRSLYITSNRIHNPFGGNPTATSAFAGVYFTGVDALPGEENTIVNNLVYNVNGDGIQYGIYNSSSDFALVYHNTIVLQDQTQSGTSATYGIFQTLTLDGLDIKNNMITISRNGLGNKFGLSFASNGITSNYNNIRVLGTNAFTGFSGANYVTLADWTTNTLQDANSIAFDPIYASPGTGNFSPVSPAVDDKGTFVGISNDILNNPRSNTTPDIGAYEFAIPPCTTPPAAGSALATPSSGICLDYPVDLTLSGYTLGSGQTYQWEFATSAAGPWTALGGPRLFPDTTILASGNFFYRVQVTCNGNTSISGTTSVTLNPLFLAGVYTINRTLPPSTTNFTSFNAAVAALECGVTGPVFFDVAPDTYTEQVRMKRVPGTSANVRITFRSANGDPSSVTLNFDATNTLANYVLKLDSASYITYQNMTITALNSTNGRAIELANTASFDSILNCRINTQVSTVTTNTIAGIYADLLRGEGNVIKGNTITNGAAGIYFEGTGIGNYTFNNVIDSNTVNNSYFYGIYTGFTGNIIVSKNTVNVTAPRNTTTYGIYATSADSAYQFIGNKVDISGITAGTTYGMYFTGCDAQATNRGRIAGNTITALSGNTSTLYGLYQTASTNNNTVNNVVSISTTGTTSYGTYLTGGGGVRFHNNSVLSTSTSSTTSAAAYFAQTSGTLPAVNIQNNIFSNQGGGFAMQVTNINFIFSNYNTFYTNGANLIRFGTVNYPDLQAWINAANWDVYSIVYQPAFASTSTLFPDLASPEVWAIHGRGTQIAGNDYDFFNNPRPTTFTDGVPDMGAYEFLPTSQPTVLTPVPATPAPGTTQTFMYGTDTVAKITYDPGAPVPSSVTLRRYSGVLPTGLSTGQLSMYFYNDLEVPAQGAYRYKMEQFYIEPWRGFIPSEPQIRMGRTNASDVWEVGPDSYSDVDFNIILDSGIVHVDRFTGLAGDSVIFNNPYTTVLDTSNRGTRFWVPYGHHYSFSTNGQDMWLYLSAEDSANVTVRVNGTNWKRTYAIPANTVRVSDIIPKQGLYDARITDEGLFERGVSITSDVPIVAYAHIYDGATSGASMLMPVGVYGYEYISLNARQYYPTGGAGSFSWFSIISDRDSTLVEITPTVTTRAGRPAGVPFQVYLMRGEVYNVMGTQQTGGAGSDLSGSTIKSIANASGNCYPIAVFSGSSRTAICNTTNGDNLIQQVFPSQAWGRKYLSFATANSTSNTTYNSNIFRIMVKDPSTAVSVNGTLLPAASLVVPGNYYEVNTTSGTGGTNSSIYVEADKPVLVAQYMVSTGANSCPGVTSTGNGDPEMIYISPIEQGIKKAAFYNTNESAITANYVNIVIPTAGLASLTIDGNSTFTDVFAHPYLPGYSCVRQNLGGAASQHIVESDSAFTAITYGLGSVESYGYNAGTLVKNLNAQPSIANTLGNSTVSEYTCAEAPFRFNILITAKPQQLVWQFSAISALTPNTDVTQNNPVAIDSSFINGRWFYKYTVPSDYVFNAPGTYIIPIKVVDTTTIEGCDNSVEITLSVRVLPAPEAIISAPSNVCLGAPVTFNGSGSTSSGSPITTYTWDYGDSNNGTGQTTTHSYNTVGTYTVNLSLVSQDGCIGDTTATIQVNALAAVEVVEDSLVVCGNDPVTFEVLNPDPGSTYDWFNTATGGTAVASGTSFTVPSVTGTVEFWVQATSAAGCISERKRVTASILPDLAATVARVDSVGADLIRFAWDAVPGALTYEVSTDNGATWLTPSSGASGLTHTVTGLLPLQTVSLIVRATGAVSCQQSISASVEGKTLPDQIFIPNAFTPNGDGLNDVLLVYGYTITSMRFSVFNQWGEKVFESFNQATGWDGKYKGKPQPSGVYMYVCQITQRDGSTLVKKGSINLVR